MRKNLKIACSSLLCLFLAAGTLSACGETGTSDSGDSSSAGFTWTGLEDVTVAAGDQYDPLDGITVKNAAGTDITSGLTVLTLDENEEELTDLGVYDDYEDFNYNITGVYTVWYMAEDGGTTEFESREVTVEQQHNIANGDFSVTNNTGFYNWTLDTPGGTATLTKVTENGVEKPKFEISSVGNSWFAMQYMSQCNLLEGETYKITVRAKSDTAKSFAFGFENVANNYSMMQGLTAFTAGSEYADYVSYYTADQDYTNAKAVLYFGYILEGSDVKDSYDLTLDSIKIEKIERCPEVTFEGVENESFYTGTDELAAFLANPLEGVTAKNGDTDLTDRIEVVGSVASTVMERNNFTLAYIVENENGPMAIAYRTIVVYLSREHEYSLANGTFDRNISFWVQDVNAQHPGQAEFSWVAGDDNEGAAQIHIVNPSTDGWHIQFRQDVTMAANTNYIITIRAKASYARSITLEINAGTNYSYTVPLTTEYTETTIYFSAPNTANGFRFLVGGGGSNANDSYIWIDSAEIELDPDQTQYEAWQMINPEFAQGMRQWGSEGTTFTAGEDDNGTYVTTTFANDTDAGWRIQLRQDGKSFKAGVTYKLVIKASSTVERDISFEINPNNEWNASSSFRFTSEVQTFEYEFTPTVDTSGSRVGLLLGGSGITGSTFTIYQFEIVEVSGGEAEA